jgi:hypothetical protein
MELHPNRKTMVGIITEGSSPGVDPDAVNIFQAADCAVTIFGEPTPGADANLYDIEPLKSDYSTDPALVGAAKGNMSFRSILAGAGSSTVTTATKTELALAMAGMQAVNCKSCETAGDESGTFVSGETITGGTSTETATFIRLDTTNDRIIYHTPSGAFSASEVLTGSTSTATVTTHATPAIADYGRAIYPNSSSATYKVGVINPYGTGTAGTVRAFLGCRGSWSMSAEGVGAPMWIDFTVNGAPYSSTQQNMATVPTPTYQQPTYYGFKGVGLTLGSLAASDIRFSRLTISSNYEVVLPENANNTAYGVDYAMFTKRQFIASFDPLLAETSTVNWFDYFADPQGNAGDMFFSFGSGAGNRVEVYAPNYSFRGWRGALRDELHSQDMEFGLHRKSGLTDNEIWIITR